MADEPSTLESEEWRDVADWPHYQVSSLGRVRSTGRTKVQRMRDGSMQPVYYPPRLIRAFACPQTRYLKVGLSRDGKRRTVAVHGMVCAAFNGERPPKHDVAHDNGDRHDNRAANLRWATRSENLMDRHRHGTLNTGERNGRAKITDKQWHEMVRLREAGATIHDLTARYGVKQTTIYERLRKYRQRS